ncbi:phosphatidate cytidylyltransferase [Legionella jordanis]|uniref:phosphatidate cytidylyltransferase n=1 Tax=Legionella jordanis TaxID=456 RepID=UPI000EFDB800|nr:phosphatidate cytidylyltransferase [Legionella jordanis]RMX17684.1 phosphatidate cytidylyltransferase [Legionella jordanis]
MFRQRLLTTLILVPLVLIILFYGNNIVFTSIILLLIWGCAQEWLSLIPLQTVWLRLGYIVLTLVFVWLAHYGFEYWLTVNLILWAFIFIAELTFPKSQMAWGFPLVIGLVGFIVLAVFAESLITIHAMNQGKVLILYLLLLVWAADIGAYLVGKQWGKHKLIPLVSPGKTIEGTLGGFLLSMLVALVGYLYFRPVQPLNWFIIAIITTFISVVGDLFISILKRRAKLKDTGNILPGHGGILDRLDSLLAASPVFYCGLMVLAPGL